MIIISKERHTISTHGATYALEAGPNSVPDDVGAYMIETFSGVTAEPKAEAATPQTDGETTGRARATRP